MKKLITIAILLLSFSLYCKGKEKKVTETLTPVKTIVVRDTTIPVVVDVVGKIIPKNAVNVFAQISGKVEKILVREGDTVFANQTLATILQEMPGSEFKPYSVKSPIKGIVLRSLIDIGKTISPQTPLFEIGDIGCLNFKGQVFGEERFSVKPKQKIAITDSKKDTIAVVQINLVAPQVDPSTGGVTVESQVCRLATPNINLLIGQTLNGHIIVATRTGMAIPRKAVVNLSEKGSGVYKLEDDKAVFTPIQIISRSEEYYLVSGLKENEIIISEGAERITDGQKVNVIKE